MQLYLSNISGLLWYQIIGVFLIPRIGIFTFAITNYDHFQEFPIAHIIAMFAYLKKRKQAFMLKEVRCIPGDQMKTETKWKMQFSELILDAGLKEIHVYHRLLYVKFFYIFKSPGLIVILMCTWYGTIVTVFIFFSADGILFTFASGSVIASLHFLCGGLHTDIVGQHTIPVVTI